MPLIDDRLEEIRPLPTVVLQQLGMQWYADEEYLSNELLEVHEHELKAYQDACTELYQMYQRAAERVMRDGRYQELGIPKNMQEIIELSWRRRRQHMHLYGRFDISGIIDGLPPKLIEFNADTATVMPETAIIQREELRDSHIMATRQFNFLIEQLTDQFRALLRNNSGRSPHLLISTMGHEEDLLNANLVAEAAKIAGFEVQMLAFDQVLFSPDGIFLELNRNEFLKYDFWFKLVPWEHLATEEPAVLATIKEIMQNDEVVIINPAYSLLYQSKGMLKVLWEMYPNHPLLLETTATEAAFRGKKYVKKVIFGREGENISVIDERGKKLAKNKGDFGHFPSIFQAFMPLPQDEDGDVYQAGVYWAGAPCALSYRRRDGLIIDEDAEFVGHYVEG